MAHDKPWETIFRESGMNNHDFNVAPFILTAEQIKKAWKRNNKVSDNEVRTLCKQDTRESRPKIFQDNGLFILPKHNGEYYVIKGEGYINIPEIDSEIEKYKSQLDFNLASSKIGDSEMQHVDYAYANSLIRTFLDDQSLVLTIRGRKFTPKFSFKVNGFELEADSVQSEVDAGYEGRNQIVLIEAKNIKNNKTKRNCFHNTIIRQLYYPYRKWSIETGKVVVPVYFEKRIIEGELIYHIWQFTFTDPEDYNSIKVVKSSRYRIITG